MCGMELVTWGVEGGWVVWGKVGGMVRGVGVCKWMWGGGGVVGVVGGELGGLWYGVFVMLRYWGERVRRCCCLLGVGCVLGWGVWVGGGFGGCGGWVGDVGWVVWGGCVWWWVVWWVWGGVGGGVVVLWGGGGGWSGGGGGGCVGVWLCRVWSSDWVDGLVCLTGLLVGLVVVVGFFLFWWLECLVLLGMFVWFWGECRGWGVGSLCERGAVVKGGGKWGCEGWGGWVLVGGTCTVVSVVLFGKVGGVMVGREVLAGVAAVGDRLVVVGFGGGGWGAVVVFWVGDVRGFGGFFLGCVVVGAWCWIRSYGVGGFEIGSWLGGGVCWVGGEGGVCGGLGRV
uniref:Uncharacterized protein n=1 Tax=Knipowitschia caucasica TaxID=637954 RepID=A0AAV2KPH9_KNICA